MREDATECVWKAVPTVIRRGRSRRETERSEAGRRV